MNQTTKSPQQKQLERHLLRQLSKTCERYSLLAPNDRVAIGLSGGKDSYTLLVLLRQFVRSLPFDVELLGLHLDQRQPGYDGGPLERWLHDNQVPFEFLSEDTYSAVVAQTTPGRAYCSLCSRLRRGVLYTALERLSYNKLALGHHRDDGLETFLMNLFFSGKLQGMPASYQTDCGRFEVIRPLIDIAESLIAEYAELAEFPILPCNLCGSQENLQREQMKRMLGELEERHPSLRSVMHNALGNVRPTHLLDLDLKAAWSARPSDVRPDPPARVTQQRLAAEPILASASGRRLPLLQASEVEQSELLAEG